MSARQNTEQQIEWFRSEGIDKLDFAIRRQNGIFIHKNTQAIDLTDTDRLNRTLNWLKAENVRYKADIYCRPARYNSWPMLFLDDVENHHAITNQYRSLAIHTSPQGGYQIWIATSSPLDENSRKTAQEHLIAQYEADPGSKSGEHWGRIAGFKNHKRNGYWVNFTYASDQTRINPKSVLSPSMGDNNEGVLVFHPSSTRPVQITRNVDHSESAREYGWVLNFLKATGNRQEAYRRLHARATARGKKGDIERYVNLTISNAEKHISKIC